MGKAGDDADVHGFQHALLDGRMNSWDHPRLDLRREAELPSPS